jgi:hypothetical protein
MNLWQGRARRDDDPCTIAESNVAAQLFGRAIRLLEAAQADEESWKNRDRAAFQELLGASMQVAKGYAAPAFVLHLLDDRDYHVTDPDHFIYESGTFSMVWIKRRRNWK